jgi:hypothetical protein
VRRPLANVGGPTTRHGDAEVAEWLAEAMDTAANEDPDALTHGFHPWPARMHRAIARVVIERASEPGARVLDPFCGGGTVPIEAMLAERRAAGVDLNPLSPALIRVKCDPGDEAARRRFMETAVLVGEASLERVQSREPVMADLPGPMLGLYGTHTLKEMAGLLAEIRAVDEERDRRALEMVFSSLVVKVSNKRAETSDEQDRKRIRKGLVTEMFMRKAEELVERWTALDRAIPPDAHLPRIFVGDSLALRRVLGERTRAQLVLTSPPYGGTYDYHAQHALRLAWLGIDSRALARREIGARRSAESDEDGAARKWSQDVSAMLGSIASVLAPRGACVLLMGDARFGRRSLPLLPQLHELAPRQGLVPIAAASQPRPGWGGAPREEHLVLLAPR